jgi:predicted esterase
VHPHRFRREQSTYVTAVALLGGAFSLGAALALAPLTAKQPTAMAAVLAASVPPGAPSEPIPNWCATGFEIIPGGGCLALSPLAQAVQPLIVYLHGRYLRTAAGDEIDRQRRLARRAASRGFAVLVLRGRLGACSDPDLADWYCWPSNDRNADTAATVVATWGYALTTAYDRTGTRRPFVLGFSNGGYFAGLLASRGLLDVEAIVVAHGGPVDPVHPLGSTPPLLLLSADDDAAQDEMIRYEGELARAGWPHDSYARAGGHGLTDDDIDAALAFFSRAKERLPLVPPLHLHRPVHHVRDAGVPEDWASPMPSHDASDGSDASVEPSGTPGSPDDSNVGPADQEFP